MMLMCFGLGKRRCGYRQDYTGYPHCSLRRWNDCREFGSDCGAVGGLSDQYWILGWGCGGWRGERGVHMELKAS